jgi:acyl-CoA synthetase (NDP forming)
VTVDAAAARAIVGAAPEGWLEPEAAHALLTAYGIPLVAERHAGTPDEAAAAALELGLPVVVKTAAAGAHKTETGGIALDLRTAAEVHEAAARMGGAIVVQQYLTEGTELLAGLVQDPVFGPLVAFGPGGVLAELIGSANFALAPLTDVDAGELIGTGKVAKLVDGWRGAPAADHGALADLLHRLSRLAVDLPEVSELDLNPVLARPDGCVAVDARIRITRPSPAASAKTW